MAWLAEQEADLKRQLEDSELKLYQYKKDRNLLAVSLDDKESMLSQNLASVNSKLTELHIKLIELDAKRKMIERARDNIADEETLPEIREKATIQKLRESYVQLSKEYADLSSRYGPEHPKMKALTGQMETVRKAYEQEIDAVLATFEKSYQELLDNEHALKALMEQQKNEAIELSKIEVEYKPLQARVRAGREDVRHHRQPAEGDRHHRPDEDQQRAGARARDRAGHSGAAAGRFRTCCSGSCWGSGPGSAWPSRSRRSTTRSRRRQTSSSSSARRCWGWSP